MCSEMDIRMGTTKSGCIVGKVNYRDYLPRDDQCSSVYDSDSCNKLWNSVTHQGLNFLLVIIKKKVFISMDQ
jgi:hypothetical protein